jgi:16S rRNA (guanine527-N7)-methyltransferase
LSAEERAPSDPAWTLVAGLERLGVERSNHVAAELMRFGEQLLVANRRTNLSGARSMDALVRAHFLDSLAPLAGMHLEGPVIDVGSGAGLPGIAAALAHPHLQFILLEPRAKRAAFLRAAVAELGLGNARVEQSSAQRASAGPLRGAAGSVLMRAVAPPEAAVRLGLPLLKRGGQLVMYLGREARPNRVTKEAIAEVGGSLRQARRVEVPYLDAVRHMWVITKSAAARRGRPQARPASKRRIGR